MIYLFGATWLSYHLEVSAAEAVELGIAPFLIGDGVKLALAGVVMPAAWRFAGPRR